MFGLLPVHKPSGITSRQAVDVVKKLVRPSKIGHTGTLDPLASGVLVLCLGPATRLASFVQALPKTYVGEFRLGVTSDSDDIETPLVCVPDAAEITASDIERVLPGFRGEITQTPPNYSAIKINGQRAYRLSRAGKSIEIKPRIVSIHSVELLDLEYPKFKLRIECGSGTYIRSLGRDIGQQLNSGAVMTDLVRTAVGGFSIVNAAKMNGMDFQQLTKHVVDPIELFHDWQSVVLNASQIRQLIDGHVFETTSLGLHLNADRITATNGDGNLLAVLRRHGDKAYRPELNFAHYYLRSS